MLYIHWISSKWLLAFPHYFVVYGLLLYQTVLRGRGEH